ncbi:RNA polymerase sigma factor [Streptomyces sp. 1222.5]|uniref:RNA polymerase sigma factor n=1 Tax=Streptomyces sp. 1222.5 TaxID=1881026 RepID=UPI003D7237C8
MNDPFGKERDLIDPDPEPPGLDPKGEKFFREHLESFRRYAAYRLRNPHDADDAVMNAVLTMHRKIERILVANSPIRLAMKILQDSITDYCRRSVRLADHERLVPEMPASSHLTHLMELGRYDQLDRAMEELEVISPLQAQCVQMRDLVGMSYAQVAEIAGITENAAKTNVCRGRKHLTELMHAEPPKEKGDS